MHYTPALTINRVSTVRGGRVRVSAVLVRPGVLSGNNGSIYYPADDIAASSKLWSGLPVTHSHPTIHGRAVSVKQTNGSGVVGVIESPRYEDDSLAAELSINLDRLKRLDAELAKAIADGESAEVSTGLYHDSVGGPGEHNGRRYETTARNFRPDHLAILPAGVPGACSRAAGCGIGENTVTANQVHDATRRLDALTATTTRKPPSRIEPLNPPTIWPDPTANANRPACGCQLCTGDGLAANATAADDSRAIKPLVAPAMDWA